MKRLKRPRADPAPIGAAASVSAPVNNCLAPCFTVPRYSARTFTGTSRAEFHNERPLFTVMQWAAQPTHLSNAALQRTSGASAQQLLIAQCSHNFGQGTMLNDHYFSLLANASEGDMFYLHYNCTYINRGTKGHRSSGRCCLVCLSRA